MKRLAFAVAVLSLSVLFSAEASPQPPQNKPSSEGQLTNATDQVQQPGTAVVVSQGDTTQGRLEVKADKAWFQDPNWWIVIITTVLAGFSGWQMVLTRKSVNSSRRAANAARRSANISYKALIIANPPRLTVRDVWSGETDFMALQTRNLGREMNAFDALRGAFAQVGDDAIRPKLRLVNEGRSEAIPYSSDCRVFTTKNAPILNPCMETLSALSLRRLGAGHAMEIDLPILKTSAEDMARIVVGKLEIYVIGVIVYTDELENISRSGFSFVWHREQGQFVPCPYQPGKDWNYQS